MLAFPKPKDCKTDRPAVKVLRDGREICILTTKAGMDEYIRRKRVMWLRQSKRCCLEKFIDGCPGNLRWQNAMFEHESGRGHGAGHRDDRVEVGGKWINGVAHAKCNYLKGSRRISYNA